MVIKEVVVLEEAVDDLEEGRIFYDQRKLGVGSYFWDSLIADIESLSIFGGIYVREYGLIETQKILESLRTAVSQALEKKK